MNKTGGLDPDMKAAFWLSVLTFILAYVSFLWVRVRMGKLQNALDRLHMKLVERGVED